MKSIYYRHLIADRMGLSAGERIVLSQLVYCSLYEVDNIFDKEDGKYERSAIDDIGDIIPLPSYMYDRYGRFCYGKTISRNTGVSQPVVSRATNKLISDGYIRNNNIYNSGYFTLITKSGLKGELLIFYSWLVSTFRKGIIFCNRRKLAEMYNVKPEDIRDYLQALRKNNLIERNENNNLVIL